MSIPVATRNAALNGIVPDHISLHNGWPGVLGSNEIAGGSPAYAREAIAFATASGAQKLSTAVVTFDVPASTIRWIGLWAGTTFLWATTNGGATPQNFIALPSADSLAATSHGFVNGDTVVFFDGTPPGGLVEGTIYFARDVTTDTFKVAATLGGAALNITSGSSFGCVVGLMIAKTYTSQDTHQVTSATMGIPD